MATQEKTWNVANRMHSQKDSDNPEVNHIIAGADEIYDDEKGAKQSEINAQTDAALADRYTKEETYSKEQLDALITTPDANYVTVATFADLPQTGEGNTVYRVSSYDGTQVDASKYALYAWNGTSYQMLAVRSAVGEVFDVSEYNSGATYETLTAALAAVPASVQRGGMSIKFILRTNTGTEEEPVYHDEYVQYRLMSTDWSTVITDWQGVDKVPTPDSDNLVRSGGVQNELALGAVYDVSAKNPTAGPNNDGKFESLSALLSDNNLNILIPTAVRKGGMSIKFVHSSDNKYVQFRCKTELFSANSEDWAFEGDDTLVENPNYIVAWTDKIGHLLFWIRKEDGGIDWAVGVPTPVKDYVNAKVAEIRNGNGGTDIDGLNKIIAFLDAFSTSDTLAALLNSKVNKVNGKGLIDENIANGLQFIENPEFRDVEIDAEGKIFGGRKIDGTKVEYCDVEYPNGIPSGIKRYIAQEIGKIDLTKDDVVRNYVGYFIQKDSPSLNEQLFTSEDVPAGTDMYVSFTTVDIHGAIGVFNSSDERLAYYGVANAAANTEYKTKFILPEGYSYVKVLDWGNIKDLIISKGCMNPTETTAEVEGMRSELDSLKDGSDVIESYFVDEMEDTISKITELTSKPCLVMNILTDNHLLLNENGKRWTKDTLANLKYLNKNVYINGIAHLGDIVMASEWNNSITTDTEAKMVMQTYLQQLYQANKNIFATPGNHDGKNLQSFNQSWWYGIIGRNENEKIVKDGTTPYFHVDYPNIKTRCIYLSTFDDVSNGVGLTTYGISTRGMNWLISTLTSTPSDYNVILFAHSSPFVASYVVTAYTGVVEKGVTTNRALLYGVCNAYNNHTSYSGTSYDSTQISCDFSSKTGKILAYIHGHDHGDKVTAAGETFTGTAHFGDGNIDNWQYTNGMPCTVVSIASANPSLGANAGGDGTVGPTKVDKTATQDCWDTMIYIPEDNKIHFIRFGAGSDREISL